MELNCSGQLMGVAFIVLDLNAIGQLLTQGSLSTSTCNFIIIVINLVTIAVIIC